MNISDIRLQLVGGGKMGQALVAGLVRTGWAKVGEIVVVEVNESARLMLAQQFPGLALVEAPLPELDTVVAVKPHLVAPVCETLSGVKRLISVAAGIRISAIGDVVGSEVSVLRVMPNTPALIGEGVSAVAAGPQVSETDVRWACDIMKSVGKVVEVDESQLDAVTGLSGSGPAYVFAVAEALVESGVSAGLSTEVAETLSFQTLFGAASLLHQSDLSPAELREQVTTPGGTTAAGLEVLADRGLRKTFVAAIAAATSRSEELGAQ